MTTSVIRAGGTGVAGVQTTGGDDGALSLKVGPLSTTVEALSITSAGAATLASTLAVTGDLTANNFAGRNKIIGGDFTTNPWQRGTSFSAIAHAAYSADRWVVGYTTSAAQTASKAADAPTAAQAGTFTQNCLSLAVTTADTSIAAGDYMILVQVIEGLNAASFGFGQAGTRYVTLSFWVKGTKTGIHCVQVANSAGNRSYVAEYTINSTNTWEYKTITIPVDTTGTWLYDTGIGLNVRFVLMSGTTHHTSSPNTWIAGNPLATSNQVNALDSTSNTFKIALVQLEAGSVATTFDARSVGTELALCQRYLPAYNSSGDGTGFEGFAIGQVTGTTAGEVNYYFLVEPRVKPTGITVNDVARFQIYSVGSGVLQTSAVSFNTSSPRSCRVSCSFASNGVVGQVLEAASKHASAQILFTGSEL
jgi:hypothetical protein